MNKLLLLALFASLCLAVPTPYNPYVCTSCGDPHITTFPGGRTDLNTPGIQAPGDYVLAIFGTTRVTESHQPWVGNPATYVNYRVAVEDVGHIVVVNFDNVKIDGIVTVVTGTYVVAAGLSITKNGYASYTINVNNGYISVQGVSDQYQNIQVVVTGGPEPSGGLCAKDTCGASNYEEFAKCWKLGFPCNPFLYQTIREYNQANPSDYPTSHGNWQTDDQQLQQAAINICAPLQRGELVDQCGRRVDPAPWWQSCIDDVIATRNLNFGESVVGNYRLYCTLSAPRDGTNPNAA